MAKAKEAKSDVVAGAMPYQGSTAVDISTLKERAIGLFRESVRNFLIVVVAYNPETKEALVESTTSCETRQDAVNKFKTKAVDLDLV